MSCSIVDVDNPLFNPSIDAISSHSRIAHFYKYRPPYIDDFFVEATRKLNITKESTILDLCCGRGELASRFSAFSKEVLAVDGSPEMLDHKISKDNVKYYLLDLNKDDLCVINKVDHVVIGSAIHWLKQATLQIIIDAHLNKNGYILVTHTLFRFEEEPYYARLQELNNDFGRARHNPGGGVDLWGGGKMKKCGYHKLDGLRFVRPVLFDIKYLLHNQLSYAYNTFFDNAMSDLSRYEREFFRVLTPYAVNNKLSAKLVNWGVIYIPKT